MDTLSIGYACLTVGILNTGLSKCILKNVTDDNLRRIILLNLSALEKILDYNIENKVKVFRISSDIIPFGSHEINKLKWWIEFSDSFKRLGEKIIRSDTRVSMHPGQYTVLNSKEPRIVESAIADLKYHCRVLDALGVDSKNKIVLHIGGVYGDKVKSKLEFIKNYLILPEMVKNRLIIENDDKNYSVEDVLEISEKISIPVVFDNLHNKLNRPKEELSEYQWIKLCKDTWKQYDGNQKIHYSQQKLDGKIGSHSETVHIKEFMSFYENLEDKNIDIMLEVKNKNLSAIKCINCTIEKPSVRILEEEWAKYKYLVLSRSAPIYNEIREMFKDKRSVKAKEFYLKIEEALELKENIGAQVNAAEHVYEYVNKECTSAQKKRFHKLINSYKEEKTSIDILKNHLFKCVINQKIDYLIDSYYFYV